MRNRDNYLAWKRAKYAANREKEIERKKKYRQTDAGKAATKKSLQNAYIRDKHKILARQAVQKAVKSGRLSRQPCEVCGNTTVDAHHSDYAKKLDVSWLCETHHYELHRGQRSKDGNDYTW